MIDDMALLKQAMEQMDAEDLTVALAAKDRAAQILGDAGLSFFKMAALIEQRGLLLRSRIVANIKRMDGPGMLGEAAFRDAGSALRKEGQSFRQVAEAIELTAPRYEDPLPAAPANRAASIPTPDPQKEIKNQPTGGERDPSVELARLLGQTDPLRPQLSLPPISILPEQNEKKAIAFRPSRRGPLELLPDSNTDLFDPEQSQLYARMRAQLTKLQEDVPSQERSQIDDAINDFLDQPPSWQAVEFKKVLWLCGNALRNKLALHNAVKDDRDPHYSKLPAGVAAALIKPVEIWNVFALGDEDLVELDSKRLGPQEQKTAVENIEAARPIVEHAAIDRHITTEQTGHVLTASFQAASAPVDNVNTRQAQSLAEGTSRNLVVQIVRRAYLFCQDIIDPRTDEARTLALEYKKGIAKAAGAATFTAVTAVTAVAASHGAQHAASFFEFVAGNADVLRSYFAIAFQNDQLRQVIDIIEYTRTSLNENPSEEGTQRPTEE
jgi:hypothetical protein